jgi:hypothetical protein
MVGKSSQLVSPTAAAFSPVTIMPHYLGSSTLSLMRSWGTKIRQLILLLMGYFRQWLIRKPIRCFRILMGLWKKLRGHIDPPRRHLVQGTNVDEYGPALIKPTTMCASRVPDSAVDPTPQTLTEFHGASHANDTYRSSSTLSDMDEPVTITLPSNDALHDTYTTNHDIPFPRGSPTPSRRYISQNMSTPNLPDLQRQRSRTPSAQRRHARPSSRVSGRPIPINNHSSEALVIVSTLSLLYTRILRFPQSPIISVTMVPTTVSIHTRTFRKIILMYLGAALTTFRSPQMNPMDIAYHRLD